MWVIWYWAFVFVTFKSIIMKIMQNMLSIFNRATKEGFSDRDNIVARLLRDNHISPQEAVILLRKIEINITADTLEMSSGAKIVGGSDFETTDYGR